MQVMQAGSMKREACSMKNGVACRFSPLDAHHSSLGTFGTQLSNLRQGLGTRRGVFFTTLALQ